MASRYAGAWLTLVTVKDSHVACQSVTIGVSGKTAPGGRSSACDGAQRLGKKDSSGLPVIRPLATVCRDVRIDVGILTVGLGSVSRGVWHTAARVSV